jgi:hypothetical protein
MKIFWLLCEVHYRVHSQYKGFTVFTIQSTVWLNKCNKLKQERSFYYWLYSQLYIIWTAVYISAIIQWRTVDIHEWQCWKIQNCIHIINVKINVADEIVVCIKLHDCTAISTCIELTSKNLSKYSGSKCSSS